MNKLDRQTSLLPNLRKYALVVLRGRSGEDRSVLKAEHWMAGSAIRVLVADDYEPLRRFVSSTLEKLPQLKLVGEASDGLETLQKAQEVQAEMILLDINLPKLNGFEVARRVRELLPQLKIIFFSEDRSFDTAEDALRLGAYGYIVKSDAGTQLVPALEAVLQGKQFVSSSLADRVLRRVQPAAL
jgi:DNA-binding NarL/FixJ family response regulator